MRPFAARAWIAAAAWFALTATAAAQTQDPPPVAPSPQQPAPQQPASRGLDPATVKALDSVAVLLQKKRGERDQAISRGDTAAIEALEAELRTLGWQFASLASRHDVKEFEAPTQRAFNLQQEVEELLRPLLRMVKSATEEPRVFEDLKTRAEALRQRIQTAEEARRAVERTRDALPAAGPARVEAETEITQRWMPAIESMRSELLVLEAQLASRTQEQVPMVERFSHAAQSFVRESGLSLLLSIAAFFAVMLGLRTVFGLLLRRRANDRTLSLRLIEVVLHTLTGVLAVTAMLVVPYVRNDWLLFSVYLVFLVGAAWVVVKTMPQFVEQIRLILNIGSVREGERILMDGLPYQVESLRFYSLLRNPALEGGELRVPIKELIGMRSRQGAPDEPWFACRTGDVVLLADGTLGQVTKQTPDVVVVDWYGSPRAFPTAAFLQQMPQNLSNGFVVTATGAIDRSHQDQAATTIATRLRESLTQGLSGAVLAGELQEVRVEVQATSPISIDYLMRARFAGSAAKHYLELQLQLQGLFVAACAQHGWRVPRPQLTVHQPAG